MSKGDVDHALHEQRLPRRRAQRGRPEVVRCAEGARASFTVTVVGRSSPDAVVQAHEPGRRHRCEAGIGGHPDGRRRQLRHRRRRREQASSGGRLRRPSCGQRAGWPGHCGRRGGRRRVRVRLPRRTAHVHASRGDRAGPARRRRSPSVCCISRTCTWLPGRRTSRSGCVRSRDLHPDLVVDTGDNLGHEDGLRGVERGPASRSPASRASSCTDRTTTSDRRPRTR